MKKYLNQLLTDLHLAHRPKKSWNEELEESQIIEKVIEDVEEFLNWEEEESVNPTFGEICGIDKEAFPPTAK